MQFNLEYKCSYIIKLQDLNLSHFDMTHRRCQTRMKMQLYPRHYTIRTHIHTGTHMHRRSRNIGWGILCSIFGGLSPVPPRSIYSPYTLQNRILCQVRILFKIHASLKYVQATSIMRRQFLADRNTRNIVKDETVFVRMKL